MGTYEDEHADDYMWNLHPVFLQRLQRFIMDNPYGVELLSGWRSNEHQQRLADQAKAKYGDDWRRWAAPPGKSNHNRGMAGDLHFLNDQARAWAHANAQLYGLEFPMGHEPWHVEPLGLAQGAFPGMNDLGDWNPGGGGGEIPEEVLYEAYTIPPPGTAHATEQVPTSIGRSLALLDASINGPLPPASAVDEMDHVIPSPSTMAERDLSGPAAAAEEVISPYGDSE